MKRDIQTLRVQGLLVAAHVLAKTGRIESAKVLRKGLERERVLLALSSKPLKPVRNTGAPRSSDVRVAALLDEFSANSFASVFQGEILTPDRWREQFEQLRPQVFFCESVWSGSDSQLRPWKGKIYASRNFTSENRGVLLEILAHCRKVGIPTVFWNKEDPTHYHDRVHDFVKTATGFDHVFTSAAECVSSYKEDYGLKSVHALPFATNPMLFNPINTGPRSDAITFAGSWYANHKERSEKMHDILRGLRASGYDLEIYNRYHGDDDPLHIWPEEYTTFLHPAVPHHEVADVYKRSRLALNINTVTQSRTMFARRIFELMSSNTLVLSNYSVGVDEMFGSDVIFCDREPKRLAELGNDDIDAIRERNLTRVLSRHTYRHRWEDILTRIGIDFHPAAEAICVVWPVHKLSDSNAALSWFQQEADPARDQLLLLAMDDMPPLEISTLYETYNRYGTTVTSLHHAEDLAIERSYAPVETNHLAVMNPQSLPVSGWLDRARLHLQYADAMAIKPADGPDYRYKKNSLSGTSTILCSRNILTGILDQTIKFYDV